MDPFFNHNFRTLIIDARAIANEFSDRGNISDAIAGELLKAAR